MRMYTVLERPAILAAVPRDRAGPKPYFLPRTARFSISWLSSARRDGISLKKGAPGEIALVKEGFSWPAFLFGPLWAFANRMWVSGIVLLAAYAALPAYPAFWPAGAFAQPLAIAVLMLVLGLHGNDLRQRALEAAGYEVTGVVGGRGLAEAEQRLFQSLGPLYYG